MTRNPVRGDLAAQVACLAGHRVLVVGDLVLDEYLTGRPGRISREAPVLVLEEQEREYRAGSAGSPAANVVALGSQATIVGVVGDDPAGRRLADDFARRGISQEGLVCLPGAATATKTRILAQGYTGGLYGRQQVLRVDRVPPLPPEAEPRCAERVQALAPRHDAVLLSDYRGGVIGESTLAAARAAGRPLVVDSQGDVRRFRGARLVKVNQAEAQAALGTPDVLSAAAAWRQALALEHLVITLGGEGMAVFSDGVAERLPAVRRTDVFDVTGAGDTVVAVLALGLLGGLGIVDAARLANAAASVVVQRLGVATVTRAELVAALRAAGA